MDQILYDKLNNYNKKLNTIQEYQFLLMDLFNISKYYEKNINKYNKKFLILLKNILQTNNWEKLLTINDLNELFDLNIQNYNDKNLYIILFNIIYSQWYTSNSYILGTDLKFFINNFLNNSYQTPENFETIFPVNQNFIITNKNYLKEYILQKKLIKYECANCGLTSWQNNPLSFHLYSTSKIYTNKNLEDLKFLCPNCYSQIGE